MTAFHAEYYIIL